jgi:hypothetical protein
MIPTLIFLSVTRKIVSTMLQPIVFIVKPVRARPGSSRGRVIKAMSGVSLKARIQETEFRSQEGKVKNFNYRGYDGMQREKHQNPIFFARIDKIKQAG